MIARRDSAAVTRFRLAAGESYVFRLPGPWPHEACHVAGPLWLSERGDWVVRGPYAWDGNSAKVAIGPVVIGVSDGPLLPDGTPAGKWPSCGHDVIYEYWRDIVHRFHHCSPRELRHAVDRWFRDEWLVQLAQLDDSDERSRWQRLVMYVYYPAARVLGAPLWWRRALGRQ